MGLKVGGYNKRVDLVKLGPSLVIATCLIVAIRTAKWKAIDRGTASSPDLDGEIAFAANIAGAVMSLLILKKADLFHSVDVPWYLPDDEDAIP